MAKESQISNLPITASDVRYAFRVVLNAFWQAISDSRDGRVNILKAGELVAGITWTRYMWVNSPDDINMWIAYSSIIGARGLLHYALKTGKLESLLGRTPRNDCDPKEDKR